MKARYYTTDSASMLVDYDDSTNFNMFYGDEKKVYTEVTVTTEQVVAKKRGRPAKAVAV